MRRTSSLNKELDLFHQNLARWKRTHHHEFVLIKENTVNFYPSFTQGLQAAVQQYGRQGYLLQKVEDPQPVFINLRTNSNP